MNRRLALITFAESLFVFPAAVFFAAGILRVLQPEDREPAHSAAQVFAWFGAMGRSGAATILLALPAWVLITGAIMLIREWRLDRDLRASALAVVEAVWRHLPVVVMTACTAFAAGVLFVVISHIITD